jgi:membrane-bound lytic murein transglycosylase B
MKQSQIRFNLPATHVPDDQLPTMINTCQRSCLLLTLCLLPTAALPARHPSPSAPHRAESFIGRIEVHAFIAAMHDRHQFDKASLSAAFAATRPLPGVIRAIQPPRDPGVRSWQSYRSRFVEERRITRGLEFWQTHAAQLAQASQQSGVPEEIIVAIIGVESIYGAHTGNYRTFEALATLAFNYPPIDPARDPARIQLFRNELEALLLLARETGRDPLSYHGSYAGALGLPQFLPSSVRSYAHDGDGDARIDLETSAADAITSVANFLQHHGWVKDGPIVTAAHISDERYQPLIDEGISPRRTPREMSEFGISTAADAPQQPAALIDLVTPRQATEYRLGYRNFYVLTRYNRSSFYAMAVHDLAQALRVARASQPTVTPHDAPH